MAIQEYLEVTLTEAETIEVEFVEEDLITVNFTDLGYETGYTSGDPAMGTNTIASGASSHAEGRFTIAGGEGSHSGGYAYDPSKSILSTGNQSING